ncbi:MAG: hypothetical protein OXD49_03930 [Candidatus Poribacteria bacterium]|nr:hypothetical protein [Candidatus Poribacteria bacterium]
MADQRMSQNEFVAYIAQKIRTGYSQSRAPQLIALSGPDCAGKSTLAVNVQEQSSRLGLDIILLSIDTFLIPRSLRTSNASEPIAYFENTFDYAALVRTLETARNRSSLASSNSPDIVLVEGVFLLRSELCHWWDLTVWIEVDTSVIMDRALKRDKEYFGDEETVRHVYENRCLPAQDYHIHRDSPRQNADITATFEKGVWTVRASFGKED